ncbi:MAG: hypothetical protein WBG58_06495, partial [Ignavibacteriaceae bacterium]
PNIKIVAKLINNDIKWEIIGRMPFKLFINIYRDLNNRISKWRYFLRAYRRLRREGKFYEVSVSPTEI